MRILKLAVFVLLLIVGCKKEKTDVPIEPPKAKGWLLDSTQFNTIDFLLTSSAINDSILIVANSSTLWYVNINQLSKPVEGSYFNTTGAYDKYCQPTLDSHIGVSLLDSHHVKVFSVLPPYSDNGAFVYSPTYSNGLYSHKTYPVVYPSGGGYPVINSKYILTPDELDYEANKVYVSLLQVQSSQAGDVSLRSKNVLTLTPADSTLGFADGTYFSAAYDNKFFLYYADQFYRIDTLGNIKKFGYSPLLGIGNGRVMQMFKLNNYLFTVGLSNWFVSGDGGETWSLYNDMLGTLYPSLTYINVDDDVYATHMSQIWKVSLQGNDLNFQELDNAGMTDNTQITSIRKVGKYVFLTTLSGLYYRDAADFNTLKN